jgi:hypothetical protein
MLWVAPMCMNLKLTTQHRTPHKIRLLHQVFVVCTCNPMHIRTRASHVRWCVQAFVGRSWSLLRPWGLLMTAFRLAGAKKAGSRGRRRAVLVGTYRWAALCAQHP